MIEHGAPAMRERRAGSKLAGALESRGVTAGAMMKRNGISEEGLSTSVRSTHLPTPPVGRVPSHPGNDYVADLEARVKGFIGAEPNDFARAAVLLGPVTAELIPLCVPPPRRR